MTQSSAYVQWVEMVKSGESKLVHPGNVVNHERFGWVRKVPVVSTVADTALSLPELAATLNEHALQATTVSAETKAPAESESLATSARAALTPKPRASRAKKDK